MSGLAEAFVGVAVIHGDDVHVTEHKAVVVILLQGLSIANVHQLGPVERVVSILMKVKGILKMKIKDLTVNQSNVFMKHFLIQQMSQSAIQKSSLKPQTASNADVDARWLGKTPWKGRNLGSNL